MKHEIVVNMATGKMTAFGKTIATSCVVRNEVNGWRKKNEIVKSIPSSQPIMPRQFPKGRWEVLYPQPREDPYLAPFFIPTTAWQFLPIWELDKQGNYKAPTEVLTKDSGYGLHFSTSNTTQGCIKIATLTDLLWLVTQLKNAQALKEKVYILVI